MTLLSWTPAATPSRTTLHGQRIRLEPLDASRHGDSLWTELQGSSADPLLWDYLGYGPFSRRDAFDDWLQGHAASADPLAFAVLANDSDQAVGCLTLMRIEPAHGCIEIGHVIFGRAMQRTAFGTEAIFLLARLIFDELGYRRLEWKCNNGNVRSRQAAERLGFAFEGVFRQHMVVKGANRDTAWYSLLDHEWPRCRAGFERWLAPGNFDARGRQLNTLAELRQPGG